VVFNIIFSSQSWCKKPDILHLRDCGLLSPQSRGFSMGFWKSSLSFFLNRLFASHLVISTFNTLCFNLRFFITYFLTFQELYVLTRLYRHFSIFGIQKPVTSQDRYGCGNTRRFTPFSNFFFQILNGFFILFRVFYVLFWDIRTLRYFLFFFLKVIIQICLVLRESTSTFCFTGVFENCSFHFISESFLNRTYISIPSI